MLLFLLLFISIEAFLPPYRFHFRDFYHRSHHSHQRTSQLDHKENFGSLRCSKNQGINGEEGDSSSNFSGDNHDDESKKTELVKNWKKIHNLDAVNMHIVNDKINRNISYRSRSSGGKKSSGYTDNGDEATIQKDRRREGSSSSSSSSNSNWKREVTNGGDGMNRKESVMKVKTSKTRSGSRHGGSSSKRQQKLSKMKSRAKTMGQNALGSKSAFTPSSSLDKDSHTSTSSFRDKELQMKPAQLRAHICVT